MAKSVKIKVEVVQTMIVYKTLGNGALHTDTHDWAPHEMDFKAYCADIKSSYEHDGDCKVLKILKGEKRIYNYEIPLDVLMSHLESSLLDFTKYLVY